MHDWTKSGWYLLANRDIEVLCGADRESLSNENFTTSDPSNKNYNSPTHPSDQLDNAVEYIKEKNENTIYIDLEIIDSDTYLDYHLLNQILI